MIIRRLTADYQSDLNRCDNSFLETQNINVAACRLYASCGFVLAGFDGCLYRGVMPGTRENALFWYLVF